jgi:predicted dehydrogenase
VRAAVLGCGAIGAGSGAEPHPDVGVITHAGAYAACPETELVAVADADTRRAEAAGRRWNARPYTDVAALLDAEAPEIVSVATPDPTHAELLERCLRAPSVRAVLAEKPLALDVGTARDLVALARERDVALAVNYSRRFAPAFQRLRADLGIGELQHVHGLYVKGLAHNGTHWLDLLRMLAGDPVAAVGFDRLREGGQDPTLDAELTLPGGVGARLAGLDTARFTAFEMDLVGTQGRVRISESGHVIERFAVAADLRHPGYHVLQATERVTGALRDTTLHAVGQLVRGEAACTGEDGVAALELVAAIRELGSAPR